MTLTPARIVRGLALLALIFLMTLLFFLSRVSLAGHEKEVVNKVLRFKQVDAEINELVLRTQFNLLHNYDPLVAGMDRLRETSRDLRLGLAPDMGNAPTLTPLLDQIDEGIDAKEELLERYKRANALRKNSQRYFPMVANEYQRLLMSGAAGSASMMDDLFGLVRDVLGQKFQSSEVFSRRIDERVARIASRPPRTEEEGLAQAGVVKHARLVADGLMTTERLIHELLDYPLERSVDALYDEVRRIAIEERATGERYRFLIFLTAVLLLVYIGYLLMRLRRTVRRLGEQKFALDQHAAVTASGTDWRITYANEAMCRLSHFSATELMGRDLWQVDGDQNSDRLRKEAETSLRRGKVWKGEYQSRDREGRVYWVDVVLVPFLDERGKPVSYTTIRTDISGRKQAERERIRLHMAIEQAADSIVITDAEGNIEYANPAFEAITGYGREEVLGLNPRFLKSGKHERAFYQNMWADLVHGKVWEGRMINRRKSGDLYEEEVRITPVLDAGGTIINYVAVKSDITRREMLVKAREFFSAIASHELRTPLTKLQLVKMMMQQGEGGDIEKAAEVLDECYSDLERLIASTTLLSELQMTLPDTRKVKTALAPMVASAVDIAKTQAASRGRSVSFDIRVSENIEALTIFGDPHLLLKAMGEILSNAVLYSPDGGNVIVTCRKERGHLEVVVVDEGVGMSKAALEMVREPFFSCANPGHHRTRKQGDGSEGIGLGLTIATLIVEAHGGQLLLDSPGEGKGVTARMLFPLIREGEES